MSVFGTLLRAPSLVSHLNIRLAISAWSLFQSGLRHSFDAFLKRLGRRHACRMNLNWLSTATRNSLSDDSLCGHLRVPSQCRSRLKSKLQKVSKKWPLPEKKPKKCRAAYSSENVGRGSSCHHGGIDDGPRGQWCWTSWTFHVSPEEADNRSHVP